MRKLPHESGYMTANTLPSGKLATVSGTPPLTIKSPRKVTINEISIYGNSVDGTGVGNRTVNLFNLTDGSIQNGIILDINSRYIIAKGNEGATPGGSTYTSGWLTLRSPVSVAANTTITLSADIEYIETHKNFSDNFRLSFSEISGLHTIPYVPGITRYSQTVTVNEAMTVRPFVSLNSSTVKISNIHVEIGSAATPYEPYGYKIPITISDDNNSKAESHNFYISNPLLTADSVRTASISSGRYKNPTIYVNTDTPPSSTDIKYTT